MEETSYSFIDKARSYRIFKIALFDLILSFVLMIWILSYFGISWQTAVLLTIPVGIVSHYIFNVDTQLNYYLGLSNEPKRNV